MADNLCAVMKKEELKAILKTLQDFGYVFENPYLNCITGSDEEGESLYFRHPKEAVEALMKGETLIQLWLLYDSKVPGEVYKHQIDLVLDSDGLKVYMGTVNNKNTYLLKSQLETAGFEFRVIRV